MSIKLPNVGLFSHTSFVVAFAKRRRKRYKYLSERDREEGFVVML